MNARRAPPGTANASVRATWPSAGAPPEEQTAEEGGIVDTLQSLRADEVYINPGLSRGLATNPELRVRDPGAPGETVYAFRGEEAYLINSKTLTITETS